MVRLKGLLSTQYSALSTQYSALSTLPRIRYPPDRLIPDIQYIHASL